MMIKKIALAAAFVALSATAAYAATQGTLGATSTGTADISVTIAEQFRISSIQDYAFGTYSGTGNLTANDDVCVYNNGTGDYRITASGSGAASAFTVASGANTIAYQVFYNDVTGTTGAVQLTAATQSGVQTGANTTINDCSAGGLSGNVEVRMLQAALQAAPAGAYTGTLTLLVEND